MSTSTPDQNNGLPSHVGDFIQRHVSTSKALNVATTLQDIVTAFSHHLLNEGQSVTISRFVYDDTGDFVGLDISATSDPTIPATNYSLAASLDIFDNSLRPCIEDWEVVTINNLQDNQDVPDEVKTWFGADTQSIFAIPLHALGNVIGIVHITHNTSAFDLSDSEINLYQSLVNQIGALVHGLGLFGNTSVPMSLASNLVATNRAISRAENFAEMVQILIKELPDTINLASIALLDRPITSGQIPSTATINVVGTHDEIYEPDIIDVFTYNEQRMFGIVDVLLKGQPNFVADSRTVEEQIVPNGTAYLNELGAYSFITIGLKSGMRLFGMLICGGSETLDLNELEINSILAFADQIAVTIDNHRLLDQTAEALSFVQHQYETANAIYNAHSPAEMLSALYDFTKDYYDSAHLALIEDDNSGLRVMAEINQGEIIAKQRPSTLAEYAGISLASLTRTRSTDTGKLVEADLPTETDDEQKEVALADTNPTKDEEMQKRLNEASEQRYLVLPILATDERLIGVVKFSNDVPVEMPFNRTRALRGLIDQVALIVENRNLMETTGNTLDETRVLYALSRDMFAAQTGIDLLKALRTHLVPNAHSASLISVDWRENNQQVTSVVLESHISGTSESEPHSQLLRVNDPEHIEQYKQEWELQGNQIEFVGDLTTIEQSRPAVKDALNNNIHAHIVIPIQDNGFLRQQIYIPFSEPQHFDERIRRLFEAGRDQIAVILKNRDLLRQTEKSLEDIQALFAISNELMTRQEGIEILRVLRNHIALDATSIMLFSLDWDTKSGELRSFVNECVINASGDEAFPESELHLELSKEGLATLQADWARMSRAIDMVSDVEPLIDERPALNFMLKSGVKSYIVLPIFEDGYQIQRILISYDEPRVFTDRDRRLYATIRDQITIVMQNRRLLHNARRTATQLGSRVRVLQELNNLSSTFLSAQDETALFEQAVQVIRSALGISHVGILQFTEDSLEGTLVNEDPPLLGEGVPLGLDPYIQNTLRATHAPVIIDDVEHNTDIGEALRQGLREQKIQSIIMLPLINIGGELIGSFGLDTFDGDAKLDQDMIEIAQTIVNQVAVTHQNIRLLADTQRQSAQVQQIANFGQSIQTIFDIHDLIEIAMVDTMAILPHDSISVLLHDQEAGKIRLAGWHDGERTQVNLESGEVVELESTTAGAVWRTQQLLHVADLSGQTGLKHTTDNTMLSSLTLPIFSRGIVIGLIEVGHTQKNAYSQADIALAQQLVRQLSVAIETAETYTQNQRIAKSKAMVNEISNELQQQTEIDRIMNVTMNELGKALGAKRARIRLGKPSNRKNNGEAE